MNRLKLVLLVAALALPVSNAQALEWIDYDGTIPDNAVSVNEGTEDRPVCRKNSRIGIVNDSGKCYSVRVGGSISKKTQDDGYQILVDNSETLIETAVAESTEDTYTADEYAAATEGMISQDAADELVEAAAAAATEGMVPEADYDAAVAAATDGMYTQEQYDAATEDLVRRIREDYTIRVVLYGEVVELTDDLLQYIVEDDFGGEGRSGLERFLVGEEVEVGETWEY